MDKKIHVHFIGICGVAMSALAIALHKRGHKITGSDKGFFPPVSDHLKNAGVEYYPGWHVDKMGNPDMVVVGNVAGSENPEWVYVQKNKIPYVSYPELIKKYFVKKNSIVCAGTYGKTTSASLLTWILKENGFDPTYMFGGLSLNDVDAAALTNSDYSVLEGDEYKSSRWDNGPKFAHYSPTHLLLTSCQWDHADVYPTEGYYFKAFQKLVNDLPEKANLVLSEEVKIPLNTGRLQVTRYGLQENNDYQFTNVKASKDGITFTINHKDTSYRLQVTGYGDFFPKNITGCFAMAHQLGIEPEGIIRAVASFKNIKRRLEKRLDGPVTVFDDIAHSPAKAQAVLTSVQRLYHCHSERGLAAEPRNPFLTDNQTLAKRTDKEKSQHKKKGSLHSPYGLGRDDSVKIIAVFEPNTGNRKTEAIPGYANAFNNADEVLIPRLTQIKIAKDDLSPPFDGQKLAEIISQTHSNVKYIDDDEKLIQYIVDNTDEGDVVVFLGSHGFRGMIEALAMSFRAKPRFASGRSRGIPF